MIDDGNKVGSPDYILATLIKTVTSEGYAGASASAIHEPSGGTMFIFFFHPKAAHEDMTLLMAEELKRAKSLEDTGSSLPPRDPRNMN